MGAAFDDEPNYFLRGTILVALGVCLFFGLLWLENAGIEFLDSSKIAQFLIRIHLRYFAGGLLIVLGFVSWIRGIMSVVLYLNSCLMMGSLVFLVLVTITGVILFIEYRPDLAMATVAERRAAKEKVESWSTDQEPRTFTAVDGRTMKAFLLGFDGKKVKIKREDGKEFSNRIGIYSEQDQSFIRERLKKPIESK